MGMAEYRGSRSQLSLLSAVLLFITSSVSVVIGQTGTDPGVFLSLSGVTIPNDGYVLVSAIEIGSTSLYCNTNRSDCCRGSDHPEGAAQGQWYRPDGSEVMSFGIEDAANIGPNRNFFSRDRRTGIVRLNRNGDPPERGRFRCEIPDVSGNIVCVYVNIVDMLPTTAPPRPPITACITSQTTPVTMTTQPATTTELATTAQPSTTAPPTTRSSDVPATTGPPPPVSVDVAPITSSGMTIVGDIHMLMCSVTVTGSTDQPTITWLVNDAEISSDAARTVSMNSDSAGRYSSTLTFNPLTASHAATYTCRATLGSAEDTALRTVNVQNPTVTVSITSSVATPIVGSMYSLTCVVSGAERLTDAMVTYQWFKNGVAVPDQTMATLSFSPLTFSDAGRYICRATVTSSLLSGPITRNTVDVVLTSIPPPLNVQATQSSSSAPVEISWSPPSDGANIITGYRIFYENERSVLLPSIATRLDLKLDGNQIGQQVSIRSEKEQEFSELIPITITESTSESATVCNNNTSVALGVVILLVVLIATSVIAALICAFLRRRPSAMKEQSKFAADDLSVSANVAYGQVKMVESSPVAVPQGVYEEFGTLSGGGATEYATCATGMVDVTHTPSSTT